MNENKIPFGEAYMKTQRRGLVFVQTAFHVVVWACVGVFILDLIIGFIETAVSMQYLILAILSLGMFFLVRASKRSLLERHEIYKVLQHLREEHGERP